MCYFLGVDHVDVISSSSKPRDEVNLGLRERVHARQGAREGIGSVRQNTCTHIYRQGKGERGRREKKWKQNEGEEE